MNTPLRLLLVEDSPDDAALLLRQLHLDEFEVAHERVETAADMGAALDAKTWDIVISDYSMPRFSGIAALHLLQEYGLDLPFILVSGTLGEESAAAAMRAGAHDYILKGNLRRLGPAVVRELRESRIREERRRAELRLTASEERLRLTLKFSNIGIWDWDIPGGKVEWSEEFEPIHGLTPGNFGKTYEAYLRLIHADDRGAFVCSVADAVEGIKDHDLEYRVVWPDSSIHWIAGWGHVTRDETGQAVRLLGMCADITSKKRAEHAAHESEARKAAVMEAAFDCIITFDQRDQITDFNAAAEHMFGQRRCQLGRQFTDLLLLPDASGDGPLDFVNRITTGQGAALGVGMEVLGRRADGSEFPAEITIGRIQSSLLEGFTACLRDVTQRKQAEAALEAHAIQIERANRELERKNEKLAELYTNAQRFVDDVSHEFRTPLTVIKGYADLMLEEVGGPLNEQQQEFLGFIADRTRELAQMVDDLLDTSKLRAGTLRVDRRPTTVGDIVSRARQVLARTAAANQMRFVERLDPALPDVFADAEKIGRVIINLVVNAIKFSAAGSEVVLWAQPASEGGVEIGVTDRGPGIAPENLAIIFERFKQVSDPQHSSTKGFGLGLSIARELVALNLGTMNVRSTLGEGSTFSFTIPPSDPAEILRCYLDHCDGLAACPEMLTAIRISAQATPAGVGKKLLGMIACSISPMDLVLEVPGENSLLVVGCTGDPDRFVKRLEEAVSACAGETRNRHAEREGIRVENEGVWPYPTAREAATTRLLEMLSPELTLV